MAEPRDEKAADVTGRHLCASQAHREHVIETLKAAFAQGRLARDEFDARIGQHPASLTSRTVPLPAGAQPKTPTATPAEHQSRMGKCEPGAGPAELPDTGTGPRSAKTSSRGIGRL